jgi:hypothetical protein
MKGHEQFRLGPLRKLSPAAEAALAHPHDSRPHGHKCDAEH